ncbi:MAG TPA: acyl-CoA dehydrogenase family protein [Allosphingosinicella sp.]|nr:acyl-CoA dehydrogenase family protein [Allosphingosinicella sp.]
MDLLPGAEEEEIARAAADYLAGELPVTRCHRPDAELLSAEKRAEIAGLGWFGLSLPEAQGGVGLSAVDDIMLFIEAGRFLAPLGLLTSALAARVAAEAGDEDLRSVTLSGGAQVALGLAAPQDEGLLRLFDWKGASLVLLLGADRASLHGFDAAAVTPVDCLDKTISMGTIGADALTLRAEGGGLAALTGTLNAAAMLVGMAEAVLAMIVDYAKIRETFGRPIGAYQAVRHPCADMAVRCEAARAQLYAAAVSLRDGKADAAAQIAAAKLLANQAAVRNADWNIQLHGGIAVTAEHDAHLYMKRANLLARLFGAERTLLHGLLDAKLAA